MTCPSDHGGAYGVIQCSCLPGCLAHFDLICLQGIYWHFTTQDNFEEFADVDEIYQSLPLVEALESLDAIPIVPPAIVVKEKVPS